ncbi:hypothetical protein [Cohnella thailandensis]|nr:hypothetical protein [Cohnella thailandensis]MBP1972209.1 hypothetical protein [Cohnella thailandensis]
MFGKAADMQETVYKPGGGHGFKFHDPDGNRLGVRGGWPKEETN